MDRLRHAGVGRLLLEVLMARKQRDSTSSRSGGISPPRREIRVSASMRRRGLWTLGATVLAGSLAASAGAAAPGPGDWPAPRHQAHRPLSPHTALGQTTAPTPAPPWLFSTGHPGPANPHERP